MKSRRDFIKSSLIVAGGLALAGPGRANASPDKYPTNIIYTGKDGGKWAKKAGGHKPNVSVDGSTLTITTNHSMSDKHYIVRHTLISGLGQFLGAKTFTSQDKAVSTYEISAEKGTKLYATSFCNQHDFWVSEFTL